MRHKTRKYPGIVTAICCLALFFVHTCVLAQQNGRSQKSKVVVHYDPTTDQTAVVIQPYLLVDSNIGNDEATAITAGFIYSRRKLTAAPVFIEFGVISQAESRWKFDEARTRELTIITDGEAHVLGKMNLAKARTAPFNSIFSDRTQLYFIEELSINIPFEVLLKMANGKNVVVRVGQQDITLQKDHRKILSELADRLQP